MKTILNLQSDYSKNGNYIQLSLPIHTETLIPVDDSVRLIDQVLEEIDYRELYLTYSSEGRNPAVSPKTLFKIMVYAYSQHIYHPERLRKLASSISRSSIFSEVRKLLTTILLPDSVNITLNRVLKVC